MLDPSSRTRFINCLRSVALSSRQSYLIHFGNPAGISLKGYWKERLLSRSYLGYHRRGSRKKADELRKAIRNGLDPVQVLLIKTNLDAIDYLSEKIKLLDAEIAIKVKPFEEDLNIILSMPGIGLISAATILAEMGDYRDFQNADKLAMYFGIVPAVYQSAGKLRTGKITKRGSKHMRRILVQVAKAISKTKKSSKLKRFFLRVLSRSGKKNVAAIALARKVLCIIYHLLMKREDYQEPEVKKKKPKIPNCASPISGMDIDEMIKTISQAGYLVKKGLKEGCG